MYKKLFQTSAILGCILGASLTSEATYGDDTIDAPTSDEWGKALHYRKRNSQKHTLYNMFLDTKKLPPFMKSSWLLLFTLKSDAEDSSDFPGPAIVRECTVSCLGDGSTTGLNVYYTVENSKVWTLIALASADGTWMVDPNNLHRFIRSACDEIRKSASETVALTRGTRTNK